MFDDVAEREYHSPVVKDRGFSGRPQSGMGNVGLHLLTARDHLNPWAVYGIGISVYTLNPRRHA